MLCTKGTLRNNPVILPRPAFMTQWLKMHKEVAREETLECSAVLQVHNITLLISRGFFLLLYLYCFLNKPKCLKPG